MQCQVGNLKISPLRSGYCNSFLTSRKRCCDNRRPIAITNAASVSSKQVQDDQVELGKTGARTSVDTASQVSDCIIGSTMYRKRSTSAK